MERAVIIVRGIVQGVFFRQAAWRQAKSLKISGWVRNEPDGSVKIIGEGKEEDLEKFIDWCHKGPESAAVNEVGVEWQKATGEFKEFSISYH